MKNIPERKAKVEYENYENIAEADDEVKEDKLENEKNVTEKRKVNIPESKFKFEFAGKIAKKENAKSPQKFGNSDDKVTMDEKLDPNYGQNEKMGLKL